MDLFEILLQAGLVTAAVVAYLIFFRRSLPPKLIGNYRKPGWNHFFRVLLAKYAVRRWKSKRPVVYPLETPRISQAEGWDSITLRTSAPDESTVLLSIRKLIQKPALAEVTVYVKLADGTVYKLPQLPDTVVGVFEHVDKCWCAAGLKIEVLEHERRCRVIYNGLLQRGDGVVQHVKFNFIWASASEKVRYPEDWSEELAAKALALEPWRDGDWPSILGKWGNGNWVQWGAMQGRLEAYTAEGVTETSVYLRVRGVKERAWSPKGYQGLRRVATLTATAKDGTALQIRGFSYKDVLTVGYEGGVRFPDYRVESMTGTDWTLEDSCEEPHSFPSICTIHVSTKTRTLKLIVRVDSESCKARSGVPYQQEVYYRAVHVDIDGIPGTGILELGYQSIDKSSPKIEIPKITLRWAKESEVGAIGYCVSFDKPAAACTNYVGGKGASLALLASVQKEMGYKVPPGYCLTVKALEKHLEVNPQLKAAIKAIEAANENYEESNFKEKCNKASELFAQTEIVGDVKEEILSHLTELKKKALEQNLGPELRFAVRSSAVGEDSEALSAAGQNETILGCASDAEVLRGVRLCWGSMFAFTSAHYRRQNGQPCLCGGGVVVQALVSPRAAGVMFTRHPARGDPSQILITANYGLGESVVSGSVEPDTIIISRGKELSITKIELGSKKQRITAAGDGVTTEQVSESERKLPCLSVEEALALAKIGVQQEEAWGAGRDIEWAVAKDGIWLLQARPITSLERWTEEELLHEMDSPIMADDELTTFANTGEVLLKPVSALSFDMVNIPLMTGINDLMHLKSSYENSITFSHYRALLNLYNSSYRIVPKKIDLGIRMMEMSIFGHKHADEQTCKTALHRRPHSAFARLWITLESFSYLLFSKRCMNDTIDAAKKLEVRQLPDPVALLEEIASKDAVLRRCVRNHATTSASSTVSQTVAMSVLVEGKTDFTTEQCNEINVLLSSGGVLSAEVPQALASITRHIEASGKADEFRKQDPKRALDWLKDNIPKVYEEVNKFLEEHGHRAVMEFDLLTKPWALVPEEMIQVLQNMHATPEHKEDSKSDDNILATLKTPKKPITRKILRWVLPLCRRTVRHRENTKAHLILAIHKLRLAARRLGKLLVQHWYLPHEELVFHFRLHELREYLRTRDPALLKKASQRYQYHSQWCKLRFSETHVGWPMPQESVGPRVASGDVRLEAAAVCGGEVVARACVVKDLSEIGQLRQGDVLITHSTDIGWSPYFPLIKGIVTELGGLISHGAVIAREYGLPCLVGAAGATDIFVTGDTVRLDANRGLIERVLVLKEDTQQHATD